MASIQGVYVALFGRPADPNGLTFFKGVTNDGADLTAIGDLSASAEYKARFEGMNNVQIVNAIYQSLFGHDADAAGLAFFVNALSTGAQSINTIAINILDGAQGTDKTIVETKVAAADAYTAALDTGSEIVAYSGTAAAAQGIAFLKGVTTTAPSAAAVDAAVKTMVDAAASGGTGTTGLTFTLTAGADVLSPAQADATKKTTDGNDTFRGDIANGDLGTVDSIDGGKGDDTVNAKYDGTATASYKPVLTAVENVNVVSQVADTKTVTFDVGDSTGITTLAFKDSTIDTDTSGAMVFSGVNKSTKVAINNVTTAAGKDGDIDINFASATGSSDTASIELNKVSSASVAEFNEIAVAGIETLNVSTTGTASRVVLDIGDTKNLMISGSKDLTLADTGADYAKLEKVDASGFSGNLDIDMANSTTDPTGGVVVMTGTGTDSVTLKAAGNVDTIKFAAANSTILKQDTITNFTTTEDKLDLSSLGLSTLKVDAFLTVAVNPAGDIADFFKSGGESYAVAQNGTKVYVDLDKDGNFDASSDLAIDIAGIAVGDVIFA